MLQYLLLKIINSIHKLNCFIWASSKAAGIPSALNGMRPTCGGSHALASPRQPQPSRARLLPRAQAGATQLSAARTAHARAQAATWAWAGKVATRLGRFWPDNARPLILIGRTSVHFARTKTVAASASHQTLVHFSFPPSSSLHRAAAAARASRATVTLGERRKSCGAAMVPLAGARVRAEPRTAPSRRTTVVLYAGAAGSLFLL
jgi:hypothetical protein